MSQTMSLMRRLTSMLTGSRDEKTSDDDARHSEFRYRSDNRVAGVTGTPPTEEPQASGGRGDLGGGTPPEDAIDGRSPATSPSSGVDEPVSVVLRRQIPVRLDEPPRSWLGGCPMMPDDVEWPCGTNPEKKGEGARPLHFVAQVACADLPPELWGRRGPRDGWLLFFLDGNCSQIEDGEQHRIVHTTTLGRERRPPADIGPVHDGVYTGSQFKQYLDQSDVPALWRRWPVDLVVFPNELHHKGPRSFGSPPDLAVTLYDGQPVATGRHRPHVEPFSWPCLRHGWKSLEAVAAVRTPSGTREDAVIARLALLGAPETILERWDEQERAFDESPSARMLLQDPQTWPEDQRERLTGMSQNKSKRSQSRARLAAVIADHPSHEALRVFLSAEQARRDVWRSGAAERHAALGAAIAGADADSPLDPQHWQAIRAALQDDSQTIWRARHVRGSVVLGEETATSWTVFASRLWHATIEVAADDYVDPARHRLVPAEALSVLEPWWRRLHENRPHKIGGFHDGVQSDAGVSSTGHLLLLQLATDDAMQWCWGDAGAIYWFSPLSSLRDGSFDDADCQIECH